MPWIKLTTREKAERRAKKKRKDLALSAVIFCLVTPILLLFTFDPDVGLHNPLGVIRWISIPVLVSAFVAVVAPWKQRFREKYRYGTTMLCVDCETVCSDHAAPGRECGCGGTLQPLEHFRWVD